MIGPVSRPIVYISHQNPFTYRYQKHNTVHLILSYNASSLFKTTDKVDNVRVCGVELKGNDAVICLLSLSDGLIDLPDCRARQIALESPTSREHLQDFQFAFAKLMEDYKVEKVAIRERLMKGKFSGGAIGFKLEAAIQLIKEIDVELISPATIKQSLKQSPLSIGFNETGLKAYQESAFMTAYASLLPPRPVNDKK